MIDKDLLISEFVNNFKHPLLKEMREDVKHSTLELFKIAIDVAAKEHGEDCTRELVYRTYIRLGLMTDPSNKLSPFELKEAIQSKN